MYVILIKFASDLNHARKTYARALLHVLMPVNILGMVCWAKALQETTKHTNATKKRTNAILFMDLRYKKSRFQKEAALL